MKDKQMIWDIKKFEDIIFTKSDNSDSYQASLFDNNCRLLSIIYGEIALTGAQHGKGKYPDDAEGNDMGYEIMDSIGDNYEMGFYECYVVSKEELMDRIKHSAKYEYRWKDFEDIDDNGCQIKGTKIHKIKRVPNERAIEAESLELDSESNGWNKQ